MALEMYAGDLNECIRHHEEFLFEMASTERPKYPQLCAIYDALYDGPHISDEAAGHIVHELIDLLAAGTDRNKNLLFVVLRLLPFFSRAYRQKLPIHCSSD